MKKVIQYTAGSHGNFLRFLFDCFDNGQVADAEMNKAGNWHLTTQTSTNNVCFDMTNDPQVSEYKNLADEHENYYIIFDNTEEFFYTTQAYTDRGGNLIDESGIELLENSLSRYEDMYGKKDTGIDLVDRIGKLFGKVGDKVPRAVLRNFFILTFMTHFNHNCWKVNEEFKRHGKNFIKLETILDYEKLQHRLSEIFGKTLDFKTLHNRLLDLNRPYQQLKKVRHIIDSVQQRQDVPIEDFNVISEAYLCFYFESKLYDINFNLPDSFFKTTGELMSFIDHYPQYMKRPNNIFLEHWRVYNVK